MGCGKGYVLACAANYPFMSVGGVEYVVELCDICRRNLDRLKFSNVTVYNCDARFFDKYRDYDVFYFGNPFDETILSVVAEKIFETHRDTKCLIYYLNPSKIEGQKAITNAGFRLIKIIEDDNEKYLDINVYKND